MAPARSLLAQNLQTVLNIIKEHYSSVPQVRNVVVYFHHESSDRPVPDKIAGDFSLVVLDWSGKMFGNYVGLD